jgi:hypothetical protein
VKLDFRDFPDGFVATAKEVEAELKRIGHTLSPRERRSPRSPATPARGRRSLLILEALPFRKPKDHAPNYGTLSRPPVLVFGFHR